MKKQITVVIVLFSIILFSCKKESNDMKGTTWKINYSAAANGTYTIKFNSDGTFNYTEGATVVNNITSGYTQNGDSVVWSFKSSYPSAWYDYRGKISNKSITGKIVNKSETDIGTFNGSKN